MSKPVIKNPLVRSNCFSYILGLLVMSLFFILPVSVGAQVNFATTANFNSKIKKVRSNSGPQLIHNEKAMFKVYGIFRNGETSELYAIDGKGKKITPTFTKAAKSCEVCFRASNGKLYCYDINCASVPKK